MTFNEEWAGLVSAAKERQPVGTRINQLEPGTESGSNHDLVVTQDDLGVVGHEAFRLHNELQKRADIAGANSDKHGTGSTAQAAKELSDRNLTMGAELLTTVSVWDSQVRTVRQMCAHISNHLDYSKKSAAENDRAIEAALKHRNGTAVSVSEISKYVK
ncbi:hypothetical protein HRW23_24050 [Streptomyces lunaelactis]|uniref:hypothetical protein n=1 Tax=Streptomyces lunaelactis TaxID=1535768 RepID=UPI00158594E5|nr:hypothetical protein [Streptomyces lunaelactis]NUK03982.1 hypothetical protein [Streptomyces lunaelactis]NUK18488.1 hypothetical protein [Streptomyces lunaelactis]NUK36981.1 hypothetical protein [Streptomyces lunaelactis]NUK45974.1 hypothetical protein [Streptomyces lunaelactis]NUK60172.1 hypothetical protein [Streptomyces lunaelactis]